MFESREPPEGVFDEQKVREWLTNRDPKDIIGYLGQPHVCPMATYLRNQGYETLVGSQDTMIEPCDTFPDGEFWDNPYWVQRFIYHIDSMDGPKDRDFDPDQVTAEKALICLNIAMSEEMHRQSEIQFAEWAKEAAGSDLV